MFKATIHRGAAADELVILKRFAETGKKPIIPILRNVLFRATPDGDVLACCTNLDRYLISSLGLEEVDGTGGICVPVEQVLNVFKTLETRHLVLEQVEDQKLLVRSGSREVSLNSSPGDEFPDPPTLEAQLSFSCPAPAFLAALDRVVFCISNEASRFQMSGAFVEVEDGAFNMVTTDGHRLAFVKQIASAVHLPREEGLVMEGGALIEISRFRARAADQVLCEVGQLVSRVTIGDRVIYGRVNSNRGEAGPLFPDYRRVIPQDIDKPAAVRIRARPLVKCCQTASKLQERTKIIVVTLDRALEVLARWDGNEFKESLPVVEPSEERVAFGISADYLAQAVDACGTDHVVIRAQDENTAVKILPGACLQVLEHVQVIMPMRVGDLNKKPEPVEDEPAAEVEVIASAEDGAEEAA